MPHIHTSQGPVPPLPKKGGAPGHHKDGCVSSDLTAQSHDPHTLMLLHAAQPPQIHIRLPLTTQGNHNPEPQCPEPLGAGHTGGTPSMPRKGRLLPESALGGWSTQKKCSEKDISKKKKILHFSRVSMYLFGFFSSLCTTYNLSVSTSPQMHKNPLGVRKNTETVATLHPPQPSGCPFPGDSAALCGRVLPSSIRGVPLADLKQILFYLLCLMALSCVQFPSNF